jgi:hypothetical protein
MKESGNFDQKSKRSLLNSFQNKNAENVQQSENTEETVQAARRKRGVWGVLRILGLSVYRLRSVFLAIPVIFTALRLAAYNSEHLPLLVGLNLQSNGEFARMISRQSAVTFPLMITGACLVLTFLSRKSIYPWLISVFSLAIPVLLLVTNIYPA